MWKSVRVRTTRHTRFHCANRRHWMKWVGEYEWKRREKVVSLRILFSFIFTFFSIVDKLCSKKCTSREIETKEVSLKMNRCVCVLLPQRSPQRTDISTSGSSQKKENDWMRERGKRGKKRNGHLSFWQTDPRHSEDRLSGDTYSSDKWKKRRETAIMIQFTVWAQ